MHNNNYRHNNLLYLHITHRATTCTLSICGNPRDYNAVNSSSQTFTKSKNLDLNHSFVSDKVVGPDRFRFVTSYWTTSNTSRGIDVGTSANNTFLSANSLPPNQKLEVDTNEGPSTLAVVLQYQGVVDLAGITAALKLPAGFKAQLPLTDDRNNSTLHCLVTEDTFIQVKELFFTSR